MPSGPNWRASAETELRLARELKRRVCRTDLLEFTSYTKPDYLVGPHHRLISAALQRVERREIDRLMIFCPPRHGKSELVSKRFPAWYLGRHPDHQFICASYGQDLASSFGREARNIVGSEEYGRIFPLAKLAADSSAMNRWHNASGGVYVAAGVGGPVTGKGADILSIDDPFKDRMEANSETTREAVWDWYASTAYTRLMPGGAVILTMTRWHPDDLAGRLLEAQETGGDRWEVLNLPAINEDGTALWPERYSRDTLNRIRGAIGELEWAALYDQKPTLAEGALFKVGLIGTLTAAPAGGAVVRAWDLAATEQVGTRDPDWTVGVKMQRTPDGRYVVQDIMRLRGGPDEVEATIVNTARQDGYGVRIGIAQDPGQAGKTQIAYLTRKLAGFTVESGPETGDKATRAAPYTSQVNVGNVSVVEAKWNKAYLDELRAFPGGTKDDQVDASSRAFSMVALDAPPVIFTDEDLRSL
jgi:predicted phage terminase large subunit-like protein